MLDQVLLDRLDRAEHPRVVAREEADRRDHQQGGVDRVGVVGLRERAALLVVPLGQHLRAHLVAQVAPLVDRTR